MKRVLLFFLIFPLISFSQYKFEGVVPDKNKGQTVFLSLIEDYRKTSRVYSNQIIQKTTIDSLGNFSFTGDQLPKQNRIYSVHIDECETMTNTKSHFMRECDNSQQILFIANNTDHISFPILENGQPLCDIQSTNKKSSLLIEIDALKEEMALDFMDYESIANQQLNFKKWFKKLQNFGVQSKEPLAELYIYDLLSDRKNETHSYYLTDINNNPYYKELTKRLDKKYKAEPFVYQYFDELSADKGLAKNSPKTETSFGFIKIASILSIIGFVSILLLKYKPKHRLSFSKTIEELSPQELRVYKAIQNNRTNKEIAAELFISISTVKTHINSIYKKMNITSRKEITKNQPGV